MAVCESVAVDCGAVAGAPAVDVGVGGDGVARAGEVPAGAVGIGGRSGAGLSVATRKGLAKDPLVMLPWRTRSMWAPL